MNFTAPRYAILFSNSQKHIVHVINHEWNRSMNVVSAMSFVWDTKPDFSFNWYQSQVFISCLYNMRLNFRIKEHGFLMLSMHLTPLLLFLIALYAYIEIAVWLFYIKFAPSEFAHMMLTYWMVPWLNGCLGCIIYVICLGFLECNRYMPWMYH